MNRFTTGKAIALAFMIAGSILVLRLARKYMREDAQEYLGLALMALGMAMGYVLSAVFVRDHLLSKISGVGGRMGCIVGGVVSAPASFYFGIISGTLGGGIGEAVGRRLGLGDSGIYVGIYLAIVVVIVVVEIVGSLAGGALGYLLETVVRHVHLSARR